MTKVTDSQQQQRLALACLAHLEQEEALLERGVAWLRQLRQALMQGDLEALAGCLARQQQAVGPAAELGAARDRLRSVIAAQCGVPAEQARLSMLLDRLPGLAAAPLQRRLQRLRHLAAEVEYLNLDTVRLARHAVRFLEGMLAQVTGGTDAGRYGPAAGHRTGPAASAGTSALVDTQG